MNMKENQRQQFKLRGNSKEKGGDSLKTFCFVGRLRCLDFGYFECVTSPEMEKQNYMKWVISQKGH